MYICFQNLLSVSLSEYSVIKRGFNRNRSFPANLSDSEYSVIKNDVMKRFDCKIRIKESTYIYQKQPGTPIKSLLLVKNDFCGDLVLPSSE